MSKPRSGTRSMVMWLASEYRHDGHGVCAPSRPGRDAEDLAPGPALGLGQCGRVVLSMAGVLGLCRDHTARRRVLRQTRSQLSDRSAARGLLIRCLVAGMVLFGSTVAGS